MKLYLGSAGGWNAVHPQHLEIIGDRTDWVLVDQFIDHPEVMPWDATKLDEVENRSVDIIYNSHLLEHIPHIKTRETLKVWLNKLKGGGELIINVPDLEWLCKQLLKFENGGAIDSSHFTSFMGKRGLTDGEGGLIVGFYGSQVHPGEFHQAGFTKTSLQLLLQEAGFTDIEIKQEVEAHDMGCLIARCRRSQ